MSTGCRRRWRGGSATARRTATPDPAVGRVAGLPAALVVSLTVAFGGSPAAAQQDGGEPASLPIGETELFPSVRIDYLTDDNAFLSPEDEIETEGVVVSPRLEWVADRRLLTLRGIYEGDFAAYDEDALDYADHTLALRADAVLGARRRTGGGISYQRDHETLGLNITRGLAGELDESIERDVVSADGRFRYGAVDARGNIEVGAEIAAVRYANLEELTDGRDHVSVEPYALFSLRVSGDTRVILESRVEEVDFDDDARDRTGFALLTGLEFVATGALSGAVRLGGRFTRFDEREDDDSTGFVFETDVAYRPVDFVSLRLVGAREVDDTGDTGGDEVPVETDLQLIYRHDWSSRVSSRAFVGQRLYDRGCPATDTRFVRAGLELGYGVRRWLEFGANVRELRRTAENDCAGVDADVGQLDFDRTRFGVFVRATL